MGASWLSEEAVEKASSSVPCCRSLMRLTSAKGNDTTTPSVRRATSRYETVCRRSARRVDCVMGWKPILGKAQEVIVPGPRSSLEHVASLHRYQVRRSEVSDHAVGPS